MFQSAVILIVLLHRQNQINATETIENLGLCRYLSHTIMWNFAFAVL